MVSRGKKMYVSIDFTYIKFILFFLAHLIFILSWGNMGFKPRSKEVTAPLTVNPRRKGQRTKEPLDESEGGQWKSWFKTQHQKTKIMTSDSNTSWQIDGETMEMVTDFIFLGSKITADGDYNHEIKGACFLEEKLWPT